MPESLASLLRGHRARLGWTQAELAEQAGISERAVSDMERGLRRVVYRDTAERLVRALGLAGAAAEALMAAARGRPGGLELPDLPGAPAEELIGRDPDVARIAEVLRDPATRLVSITGPGGVGKTRVALELCRRLAAEFPDGAAFVPLGDLEQPDLLLPALAAALRSGAGTVDALAERLAGRAVLLVLDTFEHLLKAAPAVGELAVRLDRSRVLVTSREALNVRIERRTTLAPLGPADAAELFLRRAQEAQVVETAPGGLETMAGEICRQLDGLPLAIELAAARTRLLAPAEVRDHLAHRLQLLAGGPVDAPERQRSMAATIAWSYDLLRSEDRQLLEKLAVFAGGWTLDAAEAVCRPSDPLAQLGRLVDSSLVQREGEGETRFRMLDTVREYALERLVARGGADAETWLRHASYYLDLAERAEPRLRAAEQQEWADRLAEEGDNLRAALGHAVASGDAATALRLAGALWMFWRLDGRFAEGMAWLDRVLGLDAGAQPELRAKPLWGAGWIAYQLGDYERTRRCGEELAAWARAAGNPEAARNGATLLGQERLAASDFAGAAEQFDLALGIAREGGSPWVTATSCLNRAVAAIHLGEGDRAALLLDEAEATYREIGDARFVARVHLQQTYLGIASSDVGPVLSRLGPDLAAAVEMGDRWPIAEQLDGLSALLAAGGDQTRAAVAAVAAEAAWESVGARPHPADRLAIDRVLRPVIDAAGEAWRRAFAEGRAMALEDAVARSLGER